MSLPTGGFSTLLSPDACQVAINTPMYETFDVFEQPSYASARDSILFHTSPIDTISFIWDEDSNVGVFDEVSEQEEVPITNSFIGNQATKRVVKFIKDIPVSWEAFKTDQHSKREQIGKNIGQRAKVTQDMKAILNVYGDAFAGSVNTTPDGDALASNSHTTLGGGGQNVDNLETGALAPDALWTLVTSLATQRGQDGDPGSFVFAGILVPFNLYKTAKEVMNSTLVANSGENNVNIFDTDYGQVEIKGSIYLTTTYNSASNAATSYHIVSRNHMIQRKVLAGLNTTMIEPQYTSTDSYEIRARFAEVAFPGSWSGYAGSNGSA